MKQMLFKVFFARKSCDSFFALKVYLEALIRTMDCDVEQLLTKAFIPAKKYGAICELFLENLLTHWDLVLCFLN